MFYQYKQIMHDISVTYAFSQCYFFAFEIQTVNLIHWVRGFEVADGAVVYTIISGHSVYCHDPDSGGVFELQLVKLGGV